MPTPHVLRQAAHRPVIILVEGDGLPKLIFESSDTISNPAYDEAYGLLKRGVLGHFQVVPVDNVEPITAAVKESRGGA